MFSIISSIFKDFGHYFNPSYRAGLLRLVALVVLVGGGALRTRIFKLTYSRTKQPNHNYPR